MRTYIELARLLWKIRQSGKAFIVTHTGQFRVGNNANEYWQPGLIRHETKCGDLLCPLQVIGEYDRDWTVADRKVIAAADYPSAYLRLRWLLLKATRATV